MKRRWIEPDVKELTVLQTNVAPYDDKPCNGVGPNPAGICKYYTTQIRTMEKCVHLQ